MKYNMIKTLKEALQIQGKHWSLVSLTALVLALVLGVVAFWVGMPICGSLAVAGILALGFCFYWFAVKPLTVE